MISEFSNGVKATIRNYAVQMLTKGQIQGYLAFDGDTPVGWCNANDKAAYQYSSWFADGK